LQQERRIDRIGARTRHIADEHALLAQQRSTATTHALERRTIGMAGFSKRVFGDWGLGTLTMARGSLSRVLVPKSPSPLTISSRTRHSRTVFGRDLEHGIETRGS